MVTQKKETEDLDVEYTMKHHMEQQTLMEKKINYITKKIDHILEKKFDEFNDDYQIPLISVKDVMDTEEKTMTVDQKS